MKFYKELYSAISAKIGEGVAQVILSGEQASLLDNWDAAMDELEKMIDEFDSKEQPSSQDYIKLAVGYLCFAIYKALDEKE